MAGPAAAAVKVPLPVPNIDGMVLGADVTCEAPADLDVTQAIIIGGTRFTGSATLKPSPSRSPASVAKYC